MNMKKTIAAIAAGAVAVSAMATTVSALENKAFTYNLVETMKGEAMGTATIVYTVENVVTTAGQPLYVEFVNPGFGGDYTQPEFVTVTIDYQDETVSDRTFNFCEYQKEGYTKFDPNKGVDTIEKVTIPGASITKGTSNATVIVKVSYKHKGKDDNTIKAVGGKAAISVNATDNTLKAAADTNSNGKIDSSETVAVAYIPYSYVSAYTKYKDDSVVAKVPFKTSISDNADIVSYLNTAKVNGEKKSYTNVKAVLNDAIANYDSVTFTFNTATDGIKWAVIDTESNKNEIKEKFGSYDAAQTWKAKQQQKDGKDYDNYVIYPIYNSDDDADKSYMSFTQHLYNGTPDWYGDYDADGLKDYYGFDWNGYNLFQGALVVNEGLTMSLADTDYFDYTATTLSFDWDAIMDGAATSNAYATYLNSLKLATSSTWFWDSMTVTVATGEADDVENAAGTEADDETLDEEEAEEEVIEGEAEEEEVVVEEDETEEVEVSNPTTGNASVALAVIPVALAAAAVVAKKRS